MSWFSLAVAVLSISAAAYMQGNIRSKSLQIGVKFRPEVCERKATLGDHIYVHYVGTLLDGTEFDNWCSHSLKRDVPIDFTLGQGSVIKGWDQGLLGMCVGEKRLLKIPPSLGYGEAGAPPTIPGNAHLLFETELVKIGDK
jgi:FK506-binding protein 2